MVIPLPSLSTGAPTAWALRMRTAILSLVALQCFVGVVRFYELDIFGGFYITVTSLIGYYSVRDDTIDMNCLTTYGMICFISGIFDVIILVSRGVHSPIPFFSKDLPWELNLLHAILILGPLFLGISSYLCYLIYKDGDASSAPDMGDTYRFGYRAQAPYAYGGMSDQQFVPFQGKGRALGGDGKLV